MSCCYCSEWCARHWCPGLKKDSSSSYVGVKYSLVSSQTKPAIASAPESRGGKAAGTLHNIRRVKLRHTLMQGGSQFSVHPQIGLRVGSTHPITEQPSAQRAFSKRFRQTDVSSSDNSKPTLSGSSVYREKELIRQKSVDLPNHSDPVIQFLLHYDVIQSKLRVHLEYVTNLLKEFRLGMPVRCDPFVILHLEPDREDTLRSHVIKNTHNPTFNQELHFGGFSMEDIKRQTLVFRVCNHALSNRFIGKAQLPLADVELFGVTMQMKIISIEENETNFQGDLLLSLSYSPVSRELCGIVNKATGLRKHDLIGTTDPYIKLYIEFEDQVMFKWKSSVKHNSLAPVYNECFSYTLPKEMSMALNNITVSVFVIDVHHLSPNEAMGVVTIGENANCLSGRKHWAEVIQSDQLISFWHPIQLPKKHHMRYRSPSPFPR